MKRTALTLTILLWCVSAAADDAPQRPRIFGIARVEFFSSNIKAANDFYSQILATMIPVNCKDCAKNPSWRFSVNGVQEIALAPMPNFAPADLLEEITLATDDLPAMRRYLEFHNLTVTVREHPDFAKIGGMPLTIADPEGHRISFVQWSKSPMASEPGYALRLQIIHAGFPVRNRAAEDSFYKDILGFHIYWHGAMKDGAADDWVAMQVPDGTDWLEYMLNVPPDATHRTLGVMNHISLGVPDIRAEYDQLVARGWKPTAQPNMGRDGKWQLNLFDPDDTRIEFMEFTPKEKPCCSLFTGSQPGPQTVPPAKAEGPTPR